MDFKQLSRFERINVVGTSGSGKSTFSRELAELLGLPHHEMDRLFWKPGWEMSSEEDFSRKVQEVTSPSRWILDGNYTRMIPEKWKQVQLVIWLDLSFVRTVFRVTKRALQRSLTGEEIWPGTGNCESLAKSFLSKDSVIWWAITSYRKNKEQYSALMASPEFSHICFVRLRSPESVSGFLIDLQQAAEQSQTNQSRKLQ